MKNLENVEAEKLCAKCGVAIVNDDCYEVDGKLYCVACYHELFAHCDCCGDLVRRDQMQTVVADSNFGYNVYERWCQSCVDRSTIPCADCGTPVSREATTWIESGGVEVCPNCCAENYFECAECGEYFHTDDAYESINHNGSVCLQCHEDEVSRQEVIIHDYHYGPRPLNWDTCQRYTNIYDLRRKHLFIGVELELADGGEDEDNAASIVDAAGYFPNQSLVCEHDGSLNRGFELISTTADVDYHINDYGWRSAMAEALALGYTSHDAGCCGLHIHMDRVYFTDSFENPELKAALILTNNAEWLMTFSRRNNFEYCEFPAAVLGAEIAEKFTASKFEADKLASRDRERTRLEDIACEMRGHYRALNFRGENTIEVRFNRGTLKFSTFVATLQFVQMYADAIKLSPTLEQACKINLGWFVEQAYKRGYDEFLDYITERGIVSGITHQP